MSSSDDETLLDEEFDIDQKITDTKQQLNNIKNPDVINVDTELSEKSLEELKNKLKSMPRKEIYKQLEQFSKMYNVNNNEFKSVSENTVKSTKDRLKEKLETLKLMRSSKQIIEHVKMTKEQELENSKNKHDNIEEKKEETITFSKSQKRRIREKKSKENKIVS